MIDGPYLAEVAALIGDPARANILTVLMDGRAHTATELAHAAGVTAPTTSAHLARLTEGGLLAVERQGRHRYYRLARPAVARAVESLMALAADEAAPPRHRPTGPRDAGLRFARTCYDHVAGRVGVALLDGLIAGGRVMERDGGYAVTHSGEAFFEELGIDLPALRRQRRPLIRPCLDWSERRPHLAGALGAALADRLEALGWLRRAREGRGVALTPPGRRALTERFGARLAPPA